MTDFESLFNQLTTLEPKATEAQKPILEFTLKKVIQDVANYTNIPVSELPKELDQTIIALALQVIDTHNWLTPENGNVASVSEGDTSVTFKPVSEIYASLAGINTITDNYTNILNNFRRLQL